MNCRAVVVLGMLLGACGSPPAQPDVPALLTNASPATRAEIEGIVSTALNGAPVTIADDALSVDSLLIIERATSRSIDRPPELGRDLGRPERFQLVIDGSKCFLVHERTGLRWMLAEAQCRAE
ncbi:MAG: hypothetical protein OEY08_19915 [Gammaproteobacteria bacterium]|nr:hypothetical protein [Gammaproteobacteria bacterium]